MEPYQNTKYQYSRQQLPEADREGVVFQPRRSFRVWLYTWLRQMTLKLDGAYHIVISALWGLLPEDIAVMLFVLPHVVR